ncbi:MAG TPA: hypothetical protein VN260_03010 [Dissulfurispiraceae bacterium]|nr:hypothetical protein [Dissulfurispiraceae bacterium]
MRFRRLLSWLTVGLILFAAGTAHAEVIDRIVAAIDDRAVTLSEFQATYQRMKEKIPSITEEEALQSYINRLLLLKEARKMRLEGASDDERINEYLDVRIKSLILIKEKEISDFYEKNKERFGDRDYLSVRDEIEEYLTEAEVNRAIKNHVEELRARSEIRIQLRRDMQ